MISRVVVRRAPRCPRRRHLAALAAAFASPGSRELTASSAPAVKPLEHCARCADNTRARPSVPFLLPQLSGVAAIVPHDTGMGKGTRAGAGTAWLNLLTCLIDSTEARDMTERSEACDAVSHFSSAFITAAACASGVWMFRFFSVSGATPAVRPHSHHARRSHAADSERLIGFRLALERIWADGV